MTPGRAARVRGERPGESIDSAVVPMLEHRSTRHRLCSCLCQSRRLVGGGRIWARRRQQLWQLLLRLQLSLPLLVAVCLLQGRRAPVGLDRQKSSPKKRPVSRPMNRPKHRQLVAAELDRWTWKETSEQNAKHIVAARNQTCGSKFSSYNVQPCTFHPGIDLVRQMFLLARVVVRASSALAACSANPTFHYI